MSDNIPPLRSENSIIRDLVSDWFLDNFNNGAVIRLETTSGSTYQFEIEPGKFEGLRVKGTSLFYHVRRATVIRNGTTITTAHYVGYCVRTATFAILDSRRTTLQTSNTIAKLAQLETVTAAS